MLNQFIIPIGSMRFNRGQKVNALQNIGLTLSILTSDQIYTIGKLEMQRFVIAEIAKSNISKKHNRKSLILDFRFLIAIMNTSPLIR